MNLLKRGLPVTLALIFGFATLVGLLVLPSLADLLLSWAGFLAAVALVLGVLNLLAIHLRRAVDGNGYSLILVLAMLAVFALAITDALALTENGLNFAFNQIQAPLEAALASLVAFFLLFAGARMLQHRRSVWSILFLFSVIFFLLTQGPLPEALAAILSPIRTLADSVLVTAGMRGILLGVALGIITLSLRLLSGLERPYSS
ncbi:MAG TPA: hypothetical protein VK879_04300 [Candidatus Sulfomarinibacteraceae bacterium]|nr:hypothetical protein [Candidatus Sulfomarinibacteraceae bacterium]